MATHDYDIANQTAPNFRTDLNNALDAIVSNNSNATAPSTTFAYQWWYDTTNDILKMRDSTNTGWIDVLTFDTGLGEAYPVDFDFATQAEAEAGTNNTKTVSPLRVSQAIAALSPAIGVDQAWTNQTGSRSSGVTYQNTTGKPISVAVRMIDSQERYLEVSSDNATFYSVGKAGGHGNAVDADIAEAIVPNNHYYRMSAGSVLNWYELR